VRQVALLNGYSKANVGDWLLLENSSVLAERVAPAAKQLALAMDPRSFEGHLERARVAPSPVEPDRLPRSMLGALVAVATAGRWGPAHLRALRDVDAAFSIGGGFLQMRSARELLTVSLVHLSQLAIVRRARRPLVMLPQSVGPFRGRMQRALARWTLGWFEVLLVREDESARHIRALDPKLGARVRVVPDLAFLSTGTAPPRPVDATGPLRVGIVVRQWWFPGDRDPGAAQERYLAEVARFADGLRAAGHRPVLIVHSDGPTTRGDDRISTERVRALATVAPEVAHIAGFNRMADVLEAYGEFDLVVSTRLHGALLSLIAGTPSIAIGYEWKSEGIFAALALDAWHTPIGDVTADELLARVGRLAAYPLADAWTAMLVRRRELEALAGSIRTRLDQPR
jgi:polysaccharide pyruvyl transferase WcaK-like protein